MPRCDSRMPRLYVDAALYEGASVALDASQAHYLGDVLRLKTGDRVLAFNGRDGEWQAMLAAAGKRRLALTIGTCRRPQTGALDLHYLFAPLKHARLDYMAQKAVEMGASRLQPVLTRHAQVARVNLERVRANAIEADEQAEVKDPIAALAQARSARRAQPLALAVLVGPEGGFAPEERAALLQLPNMVRLALGPRLLRADTAAVAALALEIGRAS